MLYTGCARCLLVSPPCPLLLLPPPQTLWPLVWSDEPHCLAAGLGQPALSAWYSAVLKAKGEAWAWINEHAKHTQVGPGGEGGARGGSL